MVENALSDSLTLKQLSQAERDLIVARLKERGAPGNCDLCQKNMWQMGQELVAPAPVNRCNGNVQLDIAGRIAVSAALYCKNCGNTKLLNINLLGLRSLYDVTKPLP